MIAKEREERVEHLMKVADSLRPDLSKLPGLVLIGVLMSDDHPKLIARVKDTSMHPETLRTVRETLEATGLPYVIQDVTKIDAKKRL